MGIMVNPQMLGKGGGLMNSPLSKAFSVYQSLSGLWGSDAKKPEDSFGPQSTPDWQKNVLGGQDYSDQLGAMSRRMTMQNIGGQ